LSIFNYILIRLISYQIIQISKCVFIWKHKKTTLNIAYKKWDRTHLCCIMHTTILVQYVAYKNFSHCWSIQDLEWSTCSSKGMREKLIAILLVIIFPQYGYGKYQWDTDFKTLLSQNQIDYLRFLDHIQNNMYGSDTKIVWTVQAFHDCIDTSTRWSRVCKVYTLSHALGR